jgi:NAD(P)-dependent dehydrogenase (short-subunit alcohol dehydrogenase family)
MTTSQNLRGRNIMITGASSGIGRAAALELAAMGARLYLVCRDRKRGAAAIDEIVARTDNREVELLLADLGAQRQVRKLAADFLARNQPLHVLINNAGVVNLSRAITEDSIEATFAVNHLAYFMLTLLLLERLKASAPARIINVASDVHRYGTLDFDDLQGERRYRGFRMYGRTKLANIVFSYELARRLDGTGVTVNCLHPGAVATGLGRNNGVLAKAAYSLLAPFLRSPERGAETVVYLASSPDVEGVTGKYFIDCRPRESSRESYDDSAARHLWETSARLTGVG